MTVFSKEIVIRCTTFVLYTHPLMDSNCRNRLLKTQKLVVQRPDLKRMDVFAITLSLPRENSFAGRLLLLRIVLLVS